MPYKSEQQRICKWCNDPVKKYYSKGKFKNYLKTCGSIKCLTEQYRNSTVRLAKGRTKLVHEVKCELCASIFLSRGKDGRFCKSCVPSRTWRARAERYAIGKPQWEILVEKQQGKCFLCDLEPKVVDHNHKDRKSVV